MCVSKYDPFYHPGEAIFQLVTRNLTEAELAQALGIALTTLKDWKGRHPEFREAVAKGKGPANDRVISAIFRKAVGYSVPITEVTRERVTITNPVTKKTKSQLVVTKEVRKTHHVEGDTVAAIFWAKNRMPNEWNDRRDVNLSGSIVTREADLTNYTDEELAALRAIHEAANSRRDQGGAGEAEP